MKPTIYFTEHAWEKINGYIRLADGEISGLGRATLTGGDVIISDVYLWKQENTGATTEVVDHNAVFDLAEKLEKDGVPTEEMCVWWHSHDTMDAFFSSQDEETIENWVNDRLLVAVVGNKKGEFKGTVAIKGGIMPYTIEDVPVMYYRPENTTFIEGLKKDIAENVVKKTYASYGDGRLGFSAPNWSKRYGKGKKKEPTTLTPDEWKELEEESAMECMCAKCDDYIQGRTAVFDYNSHVWSKRQGLYVAMNGHGSGFVRASTVIENMDEVDDAQPTETWNPHGNTRD